MNALTTKGPLSSDGIYTLPAIPRCIGSRLRHILYVNLHAHFTLKSDALVGQDFVGSLSWLSGLRTLLLPDLFFRHKWHNIYMTDEVLLRALPRLSALYARDLRCAQLSAATALTNLRSLEMSLWSPDRPDSSIDSEEASTASDDGTDEPHYAPMEDHSLPWDVLEDRHMVVDLTPLSQLPRLRSLVLWCFMEHTDVTGLAALTQIETFALEGFLIGERSVQDIDALLNLDSLRISTHRSPHIYTVTGNDDYDTDHRLAQSLAALAHSPQLSLQLTGSTTTFSAYGAMTDALVHLELGFVQSRSFEDSQIDLPDLHMLSALVQLTYLSLQTCCMDVSCSEALGHLTRLRTLQLFNCSLHAPAALRCLSALETLRMTDRCCMGEPKQWLAAMRLPDSCPGLKVLQLPNRVCGSTARMAEIARLHELEELDVSATAVTNAGLGELARLQQLRGLNISFCNQLTAAGLLYLTRCSALQSVVCRQGKVKSDAAEVIALLEHGIHVLL